LIKDAPPSTTVGTSNNGSPRLQQLRLSDELAAKLGTQYCTQDQLVTLMISQKVCSRVSTFVVKVTLMGDLNEWMPITLDDEHASVADAKRGVERSKGLLAAVHGRHQKRAREGHKPPYGAPAFASGEPLAVGRRVPSTKALLFLFSLSR
jgi:hypothetical protein